MNEIHMSLNMLKDEQKVFVNYVNKKHLLKPKQNEPYLETHHIEWLCNGGADTIENTVALCPNCHKKMHVVDDPQDKAKLVKVDKHIENINLS